MNFESSPQEAGEKPQFESHERQALFDERLKYETQHQAAINKENSIRERYGKDLDNDEVGKGEIKEAQREQAVAQRMMNDVDQRLRKTQAG
jgi:hypothetical protein